MSFLQKVRELNNETGVCRTCGNIERISEKLIGCIAHDKLILPDFPSYHGKTKCKDYKKRGDSDG